MTSVHFHNAFWYQPTKMDDYKNSPDFRAGLNVLHDRLAHSELENQDIIRHVRARIEAERVYAEHLTSLETIEILSEVQETGLSQCFSMIRREGTELASAHHRLAQEITTMVLQPLLRLSTKYRRVTQSGRDTMDAQIRQFEVLFKPLHKLRQTRDKRFVEAEAFLDTASKIENIHWAGSSFSRPQFEKIIANMKNSVLPTEGAAQSVSISYDTMVEYLINNKITQSERDAKQAIDRLLDLHVLKTPSQQDEEKLVQYQFINGEVDHSTSPTSPISPTSKLTGILSMWQHPSQDETTRIRLVGSYDAADEALRIAVEKADDMRLAVEVAMFSHLDEMEYMELERIRGLKQGKS
ncbi:Rho-GTPase-activating protein 8 [Umbelopsis sp. WA50703]